jgi:hypothetical protein
MVKIKTGSIRLHSTVREPFIVRPFLAFNYYSFLKGDKDIRLVKLLDDASRREIALKYSIDGYPCPF